MQARQEIAAEAINLLNQILATEFEEEDLEDELALVRNMVVPMSLYSWKALWRTSLNPNRVADVDYWRFDHTPLGVLDLLKAHQRGTERENRRNEVFGSWRNGTPAQKLVGMKKTITTIHEIALCALGWYRDAQRTPDMGKVLLRTTSFRTRLYNIIAQNRRLAVGMPDDYHDLVCYLNTHTKLAAAFQDHNAPITVADIMDGLYRLFGFGFGINYTTPSLVKRGLFAPIVMGQNVNNLLGVQAEDGDRVDDVTEDSRNAQITGFFTYHFTARAQNQVVNPQNMAANANAGIDAPPRPANGNNPRGGIGGGRGGLVGGRGRGG